MKHECCVVELLQFGHGSPGNSQMYNDYVALLSDSDLEEDELFNRSSADLSTLPTTAIESIGAGNSKAGHLDVARLRAMCEEATGNGQNSEELCVLLIFGLNPGVAG
jgi:hypothetical protein